jgi:hypothetical protein
VQKVDLRQQQLSPKLKFTTTKSNATILYVRYILAHTALPLLPISHSICGINKTATY